MLVKKGFTTHSKVNILGQSQIKAELASPEILARLEKHAKRSRSLAPKSDDFLYFSIIFLKAAESSIIDEAGEIKKVGKEKAWGYFDNSWKWHGNVQPHRNSNRDIFPELELKKAARDWIGKPLCVDHKSDTVDGVRGIILDTHYDEKRKQVVGLCALDKVNYPDLARKVATGIVRFGSMGTGVEQSICSECSNIALAPADYCVHINKRAAWGEINIGLKPIEYSLVVQPAEPGAILLRCIASLETKSSELKSYGLNNVDGVLKTLNLTQANALDLILDKVCEGESCSLEQRKEIVTSFVESNGFTKEAGVKNIADYAELADTLAKLDATGLPEGTIKELQDEAMGVFREGQQMRDQSASPEGITSGDSVDGPAQGLTGLSDNMNSTLESATRSDTSMLAGVTEPAPDDFGDTGVGLHDYNNGSFAADDNLLEKFTIKSITEDIMKEAIKRRRAEARRKIAYHQGGSEGIEPSGTYTDEDFPWDKDKHMTPNPAQTGSDGLMGDDAAIKENLKRAKDGSTSKKKAFHQGGSAPAIEPAGTYKSEDYKKYWNDDKHMHQTGNMGGATGTFPGDEQTKAHHKRASYNGPALKTKVRQVKRLNGSLNKAASVFEVYAGDNLVIATTAGEIWGSKLASKWAYFASQEYGKDVAQAIRNEGLHAVAMVLTKRAQELPPAQPAGGDMAAAGPATPMDDLGAPDMGDEFGDLPEEDLGDESYEDDPKAAIENALVQVEEGISEIRSRLDEAVGGDVDVNVNVGEASMEPEKLALSSQIVNSLKSVFADAENSADELALLAETFEGAGKLVRAQRVELNKLAKAALMDASRIMGETDTLLKMADTLSASMVKTSEYEEVVVPAAPAAATTTAPATAVDDDVKGLIAEAKILRRNRREQLLKEAEELIARVSPADDAEEPKEDDSNNAADDSENEEAEACADDAEESAKEENAKEDTSDASDGIGLPGETKDIQSLMNLSDDNHLSAVQSELAKSFTEKKAEEERTGYKIKLRRAYDLAMEMQKKAFIPSSRAALNEQVDRIMEFDDNAFEAFKSTVASAKPAQQIKVASDLGGINIGVDSEDTPSKSPTLKSSLDQMWQ